MLYNKVVSEGSIL